MESQSPIGENHQLHFKFLPDLTSDEIHEKLTRIYQEIIEISKEDSSVNFNINISFINKIIRNDKLFEQVLKSNNLKNSILNNKELTCKEIRQISKNYMGLKSQLESVEHTLKTATSLEVFYQALAAASYYPQFHFNKVIDTFFGSFIIAAEIENFEGLRALYFAPLDDMVASPVLSIRGTASGIVGNIYDDLHSSIGYLSFESAKGELLDLLNSSLLSFPHGCDLIGHSLGGAIAQHIVAAFPKLIYRVFYFNSPGVGSSLVEQYKESCEELKIYPKIFEFRHEWDLLSFAGGKHLPVSKRFVVKDRELVTYKGAHEILGLMEKSLLNLLDFEIVEAPDELGFWRGKYNYFTIETLRWTFAPILRIFIWAIYPAEKRSDALVEELDELTEEAYFIKKHGL